MPDAAAARGAVARLAGAAGDAGAWLFAASVVITVYEVGARYLYSAPTTWAHASVTAMCAVAFAFGGAYAERDGEHLRVDSLVDRLPAFAQRAAAALSALCGAIALGGLGWGAWLAARESVWRFEQSAGAIERWVPEPLPGPPGWPLPAIVKAALLAGTLLFLAMLLARFARRRGTR